MREAGARFGRRFVCVLAMASAGCAEAGVLSRDSGQQQRSDAAMDVAVGRDASRGDTSSAADTQHDALPDSPSDGAADVAPTPVHLVTLGPGVDPADPARIDAAPAAADPASAPTIDYPLEGAIMPSNVFPPDLMWTPHHPGAMATDLFHVRLVRAAVTVDGYFLDATGFTRAWQLQSDAFRALTNVDPSIPIVLTVGVLSGGVVRSSAPRTFRTVDAFIGGSVYYWSPPQQRLERLDVATAHVVDFLPHPGDTCIGCHAVSRDGQRLVAQIEPANAHNPDLASYDLVRDLTANPAPTAFRVPARGDTGLSFSGDNTRLIAGGTGQDGVLTTGTDASTSGLDPEWSPDSASIAFTNSRNDLFTLQVLPGNQFGTPTQLHLGASLPGGTVDWHPTWSPNSQWLAFQHGTTRTSATDRHRGEPGALYLVARSGGTPVRLDRLNGGAMESDSYRPLFSPFDSGGYFWLLFTSTRDYGNASAGVRGEKQVWVAAIRHRPDGTNDPSEVPYYLAGQERTTVLSPFWAAAACRSNGNACSVGGECCSGDCSRDSSGAMTCGTPMTTMTCRMRGEMCGGGGDCCTGLECTGAHLCDIPVPG